MYSKSLLIAIAAVALSATSAQAYSGQVLARAKLTEEQQAAFEVARELKEEGDITAAKEVLIEAGIDEEVLERLRSALSEAKQQSSEALQKSLRNDDFTGFLEAIAHTPLRDLITSEEDFARFKEAYELEGSGDRAAAREIFADLGLTAAQILEHHQEKHGWPTRAQLTWAEEEALRVAKAANDHETVEAILEEAGIHMPHMAKRLKDGRWFNEE